MFGLALNLSAQTTDEELDQAELIKQFIGSWEKEVGEDTVISLRISPHNHGIYVAQENKANGNIYFTLKQVIGFSDDKKMFIGAFIAPDGTAIIDIGKFVSKDRYVADRYYGNMTRAVGQGMWEVSPESCSVHFIWRGDEMIWPDEWGWEETFRKVD